MAAILSRLLWKRRPGDKVPRADSHKPDATEARFADPPECVIKALWRLVANMCVPQDPHPSVSVALRKTSLPESDRPSR